MVIYEISARWWLADRDDSSPVDSVPDGPQLADLRKIGVSHLWLMGAWRTGPLGTAHARSQPGLHRELANHLPEATPEDLVGSPFAISGYQIAHEFGGVDALRALREQLAAHEIRLILDFIPNHFGLDHPWLKQHPDRLVAAQPHDDDFVTVKTRGGRKRFLAHGRDPYFPPWNDTVQIDLRHPETRLALIAELLQIAELCDGVRCDMAMLGLQDIFEQTWHRHPCAVTPAKGEFWAEAIQAVKAAHPSFSFIAEAYWGKESRLLELGFDLVYEKGFLDQLWAHDPPRVQRWLRELPAACLHRGLRFLENHDEHRAADRFDDAEHRAAAALTLMLPGAVLLHDGQLQGARVKSPVQFARRVKEVPQAGIETFYLELLSTLERLQLRRLPAELLHPLEAWPGNHTHQDLIIVLRHAPDSPAYLCVVNLSNHHSQARIPAHGMYLDGITRLRDELSGLLVQFGSDLEAQETFFVDLAPYRFHCFRLAQTD